MTVEELEAENKRLKKLLGQCMERQINPPVMFEELSQQHLDQCVNEAMEFVHGEYRPLLWHLYWKKDYSL